MDGICDACGEQGELIREYKEYKFCSVKCQRLARSGKVPHIKTKFCDRCGKGCDKSRRTPMGVYCCSDRCVEALRSFTCVCGKKCFGHIEILGLPYCSIECVNNQDSF